MRLYRYTLRPLSPWATPLRSDTLYGLLLWRIAERQGDTACGEAITAFREGRPPFVLSSALPEGQVFAPRLPAAPRALFRQWVEKGAFHDSSGAPLGLFSALQHYKSFRKQAYLPLAVWQEHASALSVRHLFAWYCARPAARPEAVTATSVEPHVSIDRRHDGALEGGLFSNRLQWFAPGTHLHLYARTDAPDTLLALLAEAGDLGFGKDAALGKGRFAAALDEDFWPDALENGGPSSLLLSVCAAPDMAGLDGCYTTEIKRGKAWSSLLGPFKNPLLLLREGSLLHALPHGPFVLDGIHPDARLVQVTQPLLLPCHMAKEV